MKTIEYNGRQIKTNLGNNYPFCDGNDKATMEMRLPQVVLTPGDKYSHRETDTEMFDRLASMGYNRITFYKTTTAVRGYYDTIAFVK